MMLLNLRREGATFAAQVVNLVLKTNDGVVERTILRTNGGELLNDFGNGLERDMLDVGQERAVGVDGAVTECFGMSAPMA